MPDNGSTPSQKTRVILVGVGGATCSGKTTLAKHLKRILPESVIIHQDDFAPPQEEVPVHPIHNVQDWDAAPGAILWPKLIQFLREVKTTGKIPADHQSHDHLNEQKDIKIGDSVRDMWIESFETMRKEREQRGEEKIIWGLVDGFLLYWNQEVIDELDVRVFLRVPEPVLKKRRHERHGYHTAGKHPFVSGERKAILTGVLIDLLPQIILSRPTSTVRPPSFLLLEFNRIQRDHYGETHRATGNK
ncbi:hypothetical protein C0991_000783 [Blastosporella zonata]|nr:hypothetical protein C0991_000783 [Blastosporella zonata]